MAAAESGSASQKYRFLIGIIDFALYACEAAGMTVHDAIRRLYLDELRIAGALCPLPA
jgi:hypothetical protein